MTSEFDHLEESWKTVSPTLTASIDKTNVIFGQLEDIEQWLQTAKNAFGRGEDVNPLLQQAYVQFYFVLNKLMFYLKEWFSSVEKVFAKL